MNPTEQLENQLRQALRPEDAPDGFTERLLQRLPPARMPEPVVVVLPSRAAPKARRYGLPAALAASLVAAVLLGQQLAMHRMEKEQAAGLAAKQELLQALRVTSQKLDMAHQAVSNPPAAGDEENRS
jgi:hypothetical protein